ncbi:unnamed protein product [Rodentolepis nana]|uniref:Uncharacterized protein n=1 Tax=Rodentolepis nana TaxID=102285 RepID=A0A3P7RX18_RODNA|nr:unnamed protein product [Rodentolepis nana]
MLSVLVFRAGHRIRCFAKQSCPVRSLNSATASILGQSGMSESATVHCSADPCIAKSLSPSYQDQGLFFWESIVVLPATRSIASIGVDFIPEHGIASMGVDLIPPVISLVMLWPSIPLVISRNAWLCAFSYWFESHLCGCNEFLSGLRVTSVAVMSGGRSRVTSVAVMSGSQQ